MSARMWPEKGLLSSPPIKADCAAIKPGMCPTLTYRSIWSPVICRALSLYMGFALQLKCPAAKRLVGGC